MEEFEYHGCKIIFEVIDENEGYIGKGKIIYKEEGQCEEGHLTGEHQSTKEAAYESIMKKFRNFAQVGVAADFSEQGNKYNKDLLD